MYFGEFLQPAMTPLSASTVVAGEEFSLARGEEEEKERKRKRKK